MKVTKGSAKRGAETTRKTGRTTMGKLKSYQEQLQDIVEKGINAAEEQQKKLASKPFDYAEKLEAEAREYSVKTLRKRYNGYSENLFEQLRSLNSRFGNFAAELVAKLEKEAAEGADAVSEAADDVSEAAQDAKKSVTAKKPAARKTTARKPAAKKTTAATA
jgi:DNA repair ATPase RecN